jgi:putative transposase
MSQVYHRLFYHVIWRTFLSRPDITTETEKVLYPFLIEKAKGYHCYAHGANGVEDHVHLAISIPPSIAVSDVIGKLKGSSSHFLNRQLQITQGFSWQGGFGVFTFAEKDLPGILAYIRSQKEHHRAKTLIDGLEQTDDDESSSRWVG